ncbi:universal stress protein [uncultured Mycobacterium sp.]|uniref:universal stress protein n=1 Tax=uncultured Mycobacterium sp. TaxID=171292 RepID=UPI0035CB4206
MSITVTAWIVESTWPACVDGARRYAPPDADIVLLHISDPDVVRVARGAYAGLLGRGQPHRDPAAQVEDLAATAARELLDQAAARLARPCQQVQRRGRVEAEVITAATGAELLVLARDAGPGPRSLAPASRYVVDHAPCPVLLI